MTNIENEGNTSDYEGHTDKLYSREVVFLEIFTNNTSLLICKKKVEFYNF